MTEQEFLLLKEKLTCISRLRGRISAQKKKTALWTRLETESKSERVRESCRKWILDSIAKTKKLQKEFSECKIENININK